MNGDDLLYDEIVLLARTMFRDALIVPNLGTNTAALLRNSARDCELYMWGGMGLAHSIALGVAIARPQRTVVVLDGDGALLMGLSGLTTIGVLQPPNLVHVVLDNYVWGNTGGQATHTATGRVDLLTVAQGCSYPSVARAKDVAELRACFDRYVASPMLTMVHMPVPFVEIDRPSGSPDPVGIKDRFMRAAAG